MIQYKLNVSFDAVDQDKFVEMILTLSGGSFKYTFRKSIVAPNKMEFEFEGLSRQGADNVKTKFRDFNLKGGSFTEIEVYG